MVLSDEAEVWVTEYAWQVSVLLRKGRELFYLEVGLSLLTMQLIFVVNSYNLWVYIFLM